MSETIQFIAGHGYLVIFFWLLAEQAALPIPSLPLLLISGALVRTGQLNLSSVFAYAFVACVIADNAWFQMGRRYSSRALQLICRMSIEPDSCVRRTENLFVRYGLRSLLVSKFIPGLNVVAAPLAGGSGAALSRFLLFDSLGVLIWIGTYVLAGYIFSDELESAVRYAIRMGSGFFVILICALAAWIGWKVLQRRRFVKSVNVERISAGELNEMLKAGADITVVDVRSSLVLEGAVIPGALRIPAEDLPQRHQEIPRDREIILFCT
jgi:membrane protein DedA with SNARE-associated domain